MEPEDLAKLLSLNKYCLINSFIELDAKLVNILRFGLYPDVFGQSESEAIEELQNISSTYLFKDVLQLENLKRAVKP